MHCVPLQQPAGQMPEQLEQAPSQVSPGAQAEQACPPRPHADTSSPVRQVVPSQHPVGHVWALHTHAPPTQLWPGSHEAAPPQRQAPVESHESLVVALHPGQTHTPAMHCWEAPHGGPLPHAGPGCA